jgi:TRAP-type transport system periplasmic protein
MRIRKFLLAFALGGMAAALAQQTVTIKMGTLAPDGSLWHQALLKMGEKWRQITGGKVRLVIYPGGTLGDEPDMVNKMRVGQIQAVALTGAGMSGIDNSVMCLQVPMMIQSYEELDYIRDRVAPHLEKSIENKGYVVLNWGDAGWVHFFSTKPVTRLNELRSLKLFTWAGDPDSLALWKTNGFRPVPLAATDIMMALQTGQIEVMPTTPLYALSNQSFALAPNMLDLKWAPLVGATMITRKAWDSLPADKRGELMAAAKEAGLALRGGVRQMGDDAVTAMQKRKLKVVHADDAVTAEWRAEAERIYPKIRGQMVPNEMFDRVRSLHNEFLAARKGAKK